MISATRATCRPILLVVISVVSNYIAFGLARLVALTKYTDK